MENVSDVILFQLIGGQPMPTYIVQQNIRPLFTVFLPTHDSVSEVRIQKDLFHLTEGKNCATVNIPAFDWPETYKLITAKTVELISLYPDKHFLLDATAGTKIMFDAARKVFVDHKADWIYYNAEKNELIRFSPDYSTIQVTESEHKIDIRSFVRLNSRDSLEAVKSEKKHPKLDEVTGFFDKLIKAKEPKFFNKVIRRLQSMNSKNRTEDPNKPNFLTLTLSNGTLKFSVKKNGDDYFNLDSSDPNNLIIQEELLGKWLETKCYMILKSSGYFQELESNVSIVRKNETENNGDLNEYDIVGVTRQGMPVIFECKTGQVRPTALDKFAAAKAQAFGRYTSVILITLFPITNISVNEKLKVLNIKVLDFWLLYNSPDKTNLLDQMIIKQNLK